MPSIYYPGLAKLQIGDLVQLQDEEFHHLAHVAHRRSKEPLRLNSGQGCLAGAELRRIDTKAATLEITHIEQQPVPAHRYALAFALLKHRRDEQLVEKCTELGVSELFPLCTERSLSKQSASTLARFSKISIAAIKQCDNPWLPKINAFQDLRVALPSIRAAGYTPILCSERQNATWLQQLEPSRIGNPCFLIGPEGGWSEEEFEHLRDIAEITLGPFVTRAETAAIAVCAQWLAAFALSPRN